MDIFKYHNPNVTTKMEQGELINGLTSKLWIERYRNAGEFTFTANESSGVREKLPLGTFVSHIASTDVMVVENHEINARRGKETEVTITGRGFSSFLENRIVGTNKTFPLTTGVIDFTLTSGYTWVQAKELLRMHISAGGVINPDNRILHVEAMADVTGTSVSEFRTIKQGELYTRVMELLALDDLGLKTIRPGTWSPATVDGDLVFLVHAGEDRTNEVVFSNDGGDLESADYLWSNKLLKNSALVSGRWVEVFVDEGYTLSDRRTMYVDGSSIDNSYSVAPTGGTLTSVIAAMEQRGRQALSSQRQLELTKAEASKEAVGAQYRTDFNVGDIITVRGDFQTSTSMRVTEYVEMEDRNGRSGYPTLSIV